jgi:hypothetical protein
MLKTRFASVLALSLVLAGAGAAGAQGTMSSGMDRYGGPSYTGAPDLAAAISLVQAGGGAGSFSTAKALTAMVGTDLTTKEVAKLTKQYGKSDVDSFVTVFSFAVNDAAKLAIAAGVKFPEPSLSGKKLAGQLVADGTTGGTFWTGYMLDHLVTHKIHNQVMDDIDAKYGATADANYHKISNQAMYDLAQALGAKSVMLASFH